MKQHKVKHILVIPTWYPIGTDKLLGQYHRDFTESLNKYGNVKANILYIQREMISKPIKYLFLKKHETIKENGYFTELYRMISLQSIDEILQLKFYTKKLYASYKKYVKKYGKPDCIHAHVTIPAGYAATYIGVKENIPVIVTEHSSYADRFFKENYKKFTNFVIMNSKLTAVSTTLKSKIDTKKCDILPNQVSIEIFNKVTPKNKNECLNLLQVCALRINKHTDLIVDAMYILKEKYGYKNVNLTVIGTGFDENKVIEICKNKPMGKYVNFVGLKNKYEMIPYYNETDISIIASNFETFSIPGVESLGAGIPVVSTDCGGPSDYLNEKCGIILKNNTKEEMAKAIDKVYHTKYNVKNLKEVASKYDDREIAKLAVNYYETLKEKFDKGEVK